MVPTANSNLMDQLNGQQPDGPDNLPFKEIRETYQSLSRLLEVTYIPYKSKTNNTLTCHSKTTVASDK